MVPQLIIDKTTDSEFYSDLKIEYTLGNAESGGSIEDENITISLEHRRKIYKGSSDLIETGVGRDP